MGRQRDEGWCHAFAVAILGIADEPRGDLVSASKVVSRLDAEHAECSRPAIGAHCRFGHHGDCGDAIPQWLAATGIEGMAVALTCGVMALMPALARGRHRDAVDAAERLLRTGCSEVVLKQGAFGAAVFLSRLLALVISSGPCRRIWLKPRN